MFQRFWYKAAAVMFLTLLLLPNTLSFAEEPPVIRREIKEYDMWDGSLYSEQTETYTYNGQNDLIKKEQTTTYYNGVTESLSADYDYNSDGSVKRIRYDDGSETQYEYYENGILKRESILYSDGTSGREAHYDRFGMMLDSEPWEPFDGIRGNALRYNPSTCRREYDGQGKLVKFVSGEYYGQESDTYCYFYDAQDRILRVESDWQIMRFIYAEDGSYTIKWEWRDKESNPTYFFTMTQEEEYDSSGNIVRYRSTSTDNRQNTTDFGINYVYDFEGNLISEKGWGYGATFSAYDTSYRYSEEGNRKTVVAEYSQGTVGSIKRTVSVFDHQNRLTREEVYYQEKNSDGYSDEILMKEIDYTYRS